jgi:chromosomal replication initiation ATPase DnaA
MIAGADKPQLRALQSRGTIQEHLADYRRKLGIVVGEYASLLRPTRHRERPTRDVLMYLLWRQGQFRLGEIAEHFGVGDSAVSHARRRVEQRLQTDRKLQSRLRSLLQ